MSARRALLTRGDKLVIAAVFLSSILWGFIGAVALKVLGTAP